MNPPKITRPAEPEVQHTFPAWYQNKLTGHVLQMTTPHTGHCPQDPELNSCTYDCTDESTWERLPSGTVIEFTQP